jgi:tail-anchored protein insertion receptor
VPLANELRSFESSFKSIASVVRWVFTNGLRFYLQWFYGKVPMFWLPKGWVPSYVEWVLAFPKAPSGSIGIQMWFIACTSVIAIAAEGLAAAWALVVVEKEQTKVEPMKEKVGTSTVEGEKAKKEL